MREYKLRGYHKKTKRLYNSVGFIDFNTRMVQLAVLDNKGNCYATKNCRLEDVILEPYIGLKDKNGVEIYENDNIKDDYSNEVATVISGKIGYDGVWNGLTGFVLDIWASDYDDEKYYELWHGFNPSNIEVVGTIHDKK